MRELSLKSQRIIKILSGITEAVYETPGAIEKLSNEAREKKDELIKDYESHDDRYFRKALTEHPIESFGFPRSSHMIGTASIPRHGDSPFFYELIGKKVMRLQNTVGSPSNALCVLYPENGYIGWHHNGNAPGYNILFSYTKDGDGHFKYYDREKDEVVYMYDKPGWNVKCGYYPHEKNEPKRVYWHAAATKSPRLSIAFVIPDRKIWFSMLDYVSEGDYDEEFLKSQGTLKELKNEGYA